MKKKKLQQEWIIIFVLGILCEEKERKKSKILLKNLCLAENISEKNTHDWTEEKKC